MQSDVPKRKRKKIAFKITHTNNLESGVRERERGSSNVREFVTIAVLIGVLATLMPNAVLTIV